MTSYWDTPTSVLTYIDPIWLITGHDVFAQYQIPEIGTNGLPTGSTVSAVEALTGGTATNRLANDVTAAIDSVKGGFSTAGTIGKFVVLGAMVFGGLVILHELKKV